MENNLTSGVQNLNINEINKNSISNENTNIKDNPNNFRKSIFEFNGTKFEIGISIYSNLIFIIITEKAKLGHIYIGEIEQENDLDSNDNLYEIRCLLGDRNDETTQFLANGLITYIFNKISTNKSESISKIQKIMISSSIQYLNFTKDVKDNEYVHSKDFKDFYKLIQLKINELMFI